jgi:hypothetical protein
MQTLGITVSIPVAEHEEEKHLYWNIFIGSLEGPTSPPNF